MSTDDFIRELEATANSTLPLFGLATDALERNYGHGKWTVRIILQHLADAEAVYGYRIKRVISEPNQVVWATDQDAWALRLDYARASLETASRVFEACRASTIELATRHYAAGDDLVCVHSLKGRQSLRDLFDAIVAHNQNHLSQIALALEGLPTAGGGVRTSG